MQCYSSIGVSVVQFSGGALRKATWRRLRCRFEPSSAKVFISKVTIQSTLKKLTINFTG